jgi:predicted secreted Zn-dependent protease
MKELGRSLVQRSHVRWNIAGVVIAIAGFAVGSLKGTMGGGGAHTAIGAAVGITGAVIALTAYVFDWRRRRRLRDPHGTTAS